MQSIDLFSLHFCPNVELNFPLLIQRSHYNTQGTTFTFKECQYSTLQESCEAEARTTPSSEQLSRKKKAPTRYVQEEQKGVLSSRTVLWLPHLTQIHPCPCQSSQRSHHTWFCLQATQPTIVGGDRSQGRKKMKSETTVLRQRQFCLQS